MGSFGYSLMRCKIWAHMVTHVKTTCVIFCIISTLCHVDTEMECISSHIQQWPVSVFLCEELI